MFSRLLYISAAMMFAVLTLWSSTACAQKDSDSVRKLLEQRDQEIKNLMGPKGSEYTEAQRNQLKDIINGIIDYESMARYALQDTYDTLSEQQRDEFIELFSSIVRDQSLSRLDIYRAVVSYNNIRVNGDSAYVETTASMDNVRTPVSYDMYYSDEDSKWYVTDMIIDDVSTAESYRRQFQSIIRKKGYEYLVETLQKRASR